MRLGSETNNFNNNIIYNKNYEKITKCLLIEHKLAHYGKMVRDIRSFGVFKDLR